MSAIDVISSLWLFIGTWAVPPIRDAIPGASGTIQTCRAQGFFFQLGLAVPLYNASLALYYLLVVKFGWKEKKITQSFVGKALLVVPFLFGLGTAVAGLLLDLYQFQISVVSCWISALSLMCEVNGHCDYNENANTLFLPFATVPLLICFLIIAGSMTMIVHKLRCNERRMKRWDFERQSSNGSLDYAGSSKMIIDSATGFEKNGNSILAFSGSSGRNDGNKVQGTKQKASKARKAAVQAACFILAFVLTWTCFMAMLLWLWRAKQILQETGASAGAIVLPVYTVIFLSGFLLPAQGLFNFIVYMRTRCTPKHSIWNTVTKIMGPFLAFFAKQPQSLSSEQGLGNTCEPEEVVEDDLDSDIKSDIESSTETDTPDR
jgi:hypothetical protein